MGFFHCRRDIRHIDSRTAAVSFVFDDELTLFSERKFFEERFFDREFAAFISDILCSRYNSAVGRNFEVSSVGVDNVENEVVCGISYINGAKSFCNAAGVAMFCPFTLK